MRSPTRASLLAIIVACAAIAMAAQATMIARREARVGERMGVACYQPRGAGATQFGVKCLPQRSQRDAKTQSRRDGRTVCPLTCTSRVLCALRDSAVEKLPFPERNGAPRLVIARPPQVSERFSIDEHFPRSLRSLRLCG